ncbi:MAG TPA: DNA-3-methyladenine glycosylase 2 family protein [Candidatus Dormibacteraeota bacterium]
MADAESTFAAGGPIDLVATLAPLAHATPDPCLRFRSGEVWRATRTPDGPATERLTAARGRISVEAWGPGAAWAVAHASELAGVHVDGAFVAPDPLLRELRRREPGVRIPRSRAVLEALIPAVLEQKVPGEEARQAYRRLVWTLGEHAPRPPGAPALAVPPPPARLMATPYQVFHRFGIERRRAETIRRAASYAGRLEEAVEMEPARARQRLMALPGVGEWTAAEVAVTALGDLDAVSVGDYHLPHVVAYALAGEPRGDDERMLELLEPYRPHRALAIRLLLRAGLGPGRRGARMPLNKQLGF